MKKLTLVAVLLSTGACATSSPTEPSPTPTNQVDYTAIGASDAIGYGASVVCFPFADCPTGTGYVPVVTRSLQSSGKTVTVLNLGIPGAVIGPDIQTIGNAVGQGIVSNFIDAEMPFAHKASTLITIFAGGNDANAIGAAVKAGMGGSDISAYIQAQVQAFGKDMATLVAGLQARAPSARIVILNLPNMAALPFSASKTSTEKHYFQQIAVGFSAQANAMTSKGAIVIDLMCDSRMYDASIYSSDGFHPNDTGYAYLAGLVFAAASGGAGTAPKASCAQMTIY